MGEPWEPETREKGLRGLVRLAELRGLAGLLELYVPEGPMATAGKKKKSEKKAEISTCTTAQPLRVSACPGGCPKLWRAGGCAMQDRDRACSPLCLAVSVPRDGLFFLSPSITSWIRQISFWICLLTISFCRGEKQRSERLPVLPAPQPVAAGCSQNRAPRPAAACRPAPCRLKEPGDLILHQLGLLGGSWGCWGPAHLDVEVQLLPEVVVQGGHLALQALVLSGAVGQSLWSGGVGGVWAGAMGTELCRLLREGRMGTGTGNGAGMGMGSMVEGEPRTVLACESSTRMLMSWFCSDSFLCSSFSG